MEDDISLERLAAGLVAEVRELPGVKGILLVGSAATGTSTPNSDYDFLVLMDDSAPWPMSFRDGGRRSWIEDDGRQVEVAYSTIGRFRRRSAEEAAGGSCLRWSELASSRMLWTADDVVAALIAESREAVAAGPPPMERQDVLWECFDLWNQLKDVQDRLEDPRVVQVISAPTFAQFIRFFFRLERRWQPRLRDALAELARVDSAFHTLCVDFLEARSPQAQHQALIRMSSHLSTRFGLTFEAAYTSAR